MRIVNLLLLISSENNGSGPAHLLRGGGGFESPPSLGDLLGDLIVGESLIGQLVFQHDELELDLALAVMLEDVTVGLLGDAGHALVAFKASGVTVGLAGLGFDEELVGLDVAIGSRPSRSL